MFGHFIAYFYGLFCVNRKGIKAQPMFNIFTVRILSKFDNGL